MMPGAALLAVLLAAGPCEDAVATAARRHEARDYGGALAALEGAAQRCRGKGDRMAIQTGRARALNALGRHAEALGAAEAVLADDRTHLFALFERAHARERLGDTARATADYERIAALTARNRNLEERATIHAKLAELAMRGGRTAEAQVQLARARALDPVNPDFAIMAGDLAAQAGDWAAADSAYRQAMAMGAPFEQVYRIRATAALRRLQERHGTTRVLELRQRMTAEERAALCDDLYQALVLGWRNADMELLHALACVDRTRGRG